MLDISVVTNHFTDPENLRSRGLQLKKKNRGEYKLFHNVKKYSRKERQRIGCLFIFLSVYVFKKAHQLLLF